LRRRLGSRINPQSKEWNGGQAKRVKLTPVKECGIPREGGGRRRGEERRGGGKGEDVVDFDGEVK
jgi:hypothetical protein